MNKRRKTEGKLSENSVRIYDKVIKNWRVEEIDDPSSDSSTSISFDQEEEERGKTLIERRKRSFTEIEHINNISKDPTKVRIPRVLKDDIRKKYPIMLINMMNCGNFDLIELFYKTYINCVRSFNNNITAINQPSAITDDPSLNQDNSLTNRGFRGTMTGDIFLEAVNDMINYEILLHLLCPDRIVALKDAKIITKSNTFQTEINVFFEIRATRTKGWTPIETASFLKTLKQTGIKYTREEMIERFEESIPLLSETVPLHVEGKFTLLIDDYRKDLRINSIKSNCLAYSW